jgi:ribosomal protein L14E/L6E/L27E
MSRKTIGTLLFSLGVWVVVSALTVAGFKGYEHMQRPLEQKIEAFVEDYTAEETQIISNGEEFIVKIYDETKFVPKWSYLIRESKTIRLKVDIRTLPDEVVSNDKALLKATTKQVLNLSTTRDDSRSSLKKATRFKTLEEAQAARDKYVQKRVMAEYGKEISDSEWKPVK